MFLNVDHIKPRWAYGVELSMSSISNTKREYGVENSQLYCNSSSVGNKLKCPTDVKSSLQNIEMNSLQNLRVLCASHNKFRYKHEQLSLK